MECRQLRSLRGGLSVLVIALSVPTTLTGQSLYGTMKKGEQKGASPASTLSPRQACSVEKQLLPGTYSFTSVHFDKAGIEVPEGRKKTLTLSYSEMDKVEFSPGAFSHADVLIHLHKHGTHMFSFFITKYSNDQVKQLQAAIEELAQRVAQGEAVVCSENSDDYKSELDDFQTKTAAWRAMATKPAPGDEVYKDRLLAEDAIKNKDLAAAVKYYEQGIAAEPTWDQGWYNAALVYAEQKDYFDAALCMRHYVLLDPSASDAQAAKDNIILWEAKAEEASATARGGAVR